MITIALSLSFGTLGVQEHRSVRRHNVLSLIEKSGIGFGRMHVGAVL
jgi:hypothetical protein